MKQIDPNIPAELLDMIPPEELCEDMALFTNLYFSENSFVKYLFLGTNGVFLLIPCKDSLMENEAEKKRCKTALQEIKEVLGLSQYIYPIFVGNERSYYAVNPCNPMELDNLYDFLYKLYLHTDTVKTRPDQITETLVEGAEKVAVLDENTIERLIQTIVPLEDNERPGCNVRTDTDGIEYILKDSDLMIGKINTGLVGKKKWFRVSELHTPSVLYTAVFGGCLGLHKLMTMEYTQGMLYALTGGFGGLLPALDVLGMVLGNYHYYEVTYYENERGNLIREKEAVYLKRYQGLWRGVICITVALLVGLLYTRFIYSNLLELLITILVELGTEAGTVVYEQGYILH